MARSSLALMVLVLATTNLGCPLARAVVNPSPALRWWLFSNFGANKICPEIVRSSVPLKLQARAQAVGRFFPRRCSVRVDQASRTVTLSLGGTGYGYTPVSKRVGFTVDATIQYRMDFRLTSTGAYVWGIFNRSVSGPHFRLLFVENPLAGAAAMPFGPFTGFVGQQIVRGELTRGFTVLHSDNGNDFTLGIIHPPQRPFQPVNVTSSEHYTYANERVQIGAGQRDYLGPFQIHDRKQQLRVQYQLQAPGPVDVLVVHRGTGDRWRAQYETSPRLTPPPGPVIRSAILPPGVPVRTGYRLPPGSYYIVVDNTRAAGRVAPVPGSGALLTVLVQLEEL